MRKIIVLLLLLVLISVGVAQEKDNVDSQIYKELENNDKVKVIVVMKEQSVLRGARLSSVKENVISGLSADEFNKKHEFSSFSGFSGEINEVGLEKLKDNPNVEKIEYLYPVHAFLQDSVPLINATLVQDLQLNGINIKGQDQTVCVIDTGIDYTHEDLGGCYGDGCKVIGGYDFVNDDEDPIDDNGHGTHVAGIIASNNSGISGVAQDIKLVAVKILDENGFSDHPDDLISAIEWCTNNATLYSISVISMSLGDGQNYTNYCDDIQSSYASAINDAVVNNITVVVAAGNSYNYAAVSSPACIENATSVGATDKSDNIAGYSNRALILDLLAPGGVDDTQTNGINSTQNGGGYIGYHGTSMATPHVAGAVALLQQFSKEEKGLTLLPSEILDVLNRTGKQISDTELTFSRIDVYEAILDLTKPIVNLLTPENDSVLNSAEVIFNVSIDDYDKYLNCSLYIDNEWNETNNLADGDIFNVTLEEDSYNSSVVCYDNLSVSDESELVEFRIDLTEPTVYLYRPENDSIVTTFPVDFIFNVSDYEVDNCILIINNVINETLNSGISLSGDTEFSDIYLANGDYNWSVNCADNVGNVGESNEWELTVSCTPSCPDEDDVCSGTTDTRNNGCGYNCNVAGTKDCSSSESTDNSGSDTGTSGGNSGGNLGSGEETGGQLVGSTFSFSANAGYTKRFSFDSDVGLTNMEIKVKNAVSGTISVSKTDKPADISEPEGSIYTYITIDKFDIADEDIEEVLLKFKVDNSWLNEHKGDVILNRYNNGWKELVTVRGDEGDDYVIYEAISPGFSLFAVSVNENVEEITITSSNESKGLIGPTGFIGKNLPENWVNWVNDNVDLSFVKGVNKYVWIAGIPFVVLLVMSIVYRKKIFSKSGKEEKEFGDHKDKDKINKKEERKKTRQVKLEEKRKKKAERLRKQLERLEGKEEVGFFSRIKSKFIKDNPNVEEEIRREKEPETGERGVFALMGKKLRGDIDEEVVKKVLEKTPEIKKEKKIIEKSVKEAKRGLFSGMKQKLDERKQRKEELLKRFEFKDIKR